MVSMLTIAGRMPLTMHPRLAAVAVLTLAPLAAAEEPSPCDRALSLAQSWEADGDLLHARDSYESCSPATCTEHTEECRAAARRIDATIPRVALRAADVEGHDLVDVDAIVDGWGHFVRLDGAAIPMNPGLHRIFFADPATGKTAQETLYLKAGDRPTVVKVILTGPTRGAPSPRRATLLAGPKTALQYGLLGTSLATAILSTVALASSGDPGWAVGLAIGAVGVLSTTLWISVDAYESRRVSWVGVRGTF